MGYAMFCIYKVLGLETDVRSNLLDDQNVQFQQRSTLLFLAKCFRAHNLKTMVTIIRTLREDQSMRIVQLITRTVLYSVSKET